MDIKQTNENNKIIAEFMNFDTEDRPSFANPDVIYKNSYLINGTICTAEFLKFHSSWDWLMPVVEKIEDEHEVTFDITMDNVHIRGDFNSSIFGLTKKESVYKGVIQFIEWLNARS